MTINKVVQQDVIDGVTDGANAANLVNDSKRATNEIIDVVNNQGTTTSVDVGTDQDQIELNSQKTFRMFDSLTSAAAFVTANPTAIKQVSTTSFRSEDECAGLSIDYPDGGGADYVVVDAGTGIDDGGSFINAGSKQLKLSPKTVNNIRVYGIVGNGVYDDLSQLIAADLSGLRFSIADIALNISTPYKATSGTFEIGPRTTLSNATSSGMFNQNLGFLAGSGVGNDYRIPDRTYFGLAASNWGGANGVDGGSWLDTAADGPHYLLRNAQILSMTSPDQPAFAVVGAAKVEELSTRAAIGLASAVVNQGLGGARGIMVEAQHQINSGGTTWGMEVAIKNASGGGQLISPFGSASNMSFGIQINGGSDPAFGPVATDPVTAAMIINSHTKNTPYGFYTGIQFRDGTIVGTEPEAISAPAGYAFKWYEDTDRTVAGVIKSINNTPNSKVTLQLQSSGVSILNNQNSSAFDIVTAPTDVNRLQVRSATVGSAPRINSTGPDTNVDLQLYTKGDGLLQINQEPVAATTPSNFSADSYIQVKKASGAILYIPIMTSAW